MANQHGDLDQKRTVDRREKLATESNLVEVMETPFLLQQLKLSIWKESFERMKFVSELKELFSLSLNAVLVVSLQSTWIQIPQD